MKRIASLVILMTFASAMCLFAGDTLKGSIGDKMCGADHHGQDPVKCTIGCVKNGSPFVLVISKDKILDIENQKDETIAAELMKHAGHNVTVTGTVSADGKSVKIEKISESK